jgi:probable rRNA maturation factor
MPVRVFTEHPGGERYIGETKRIVEYVLKGEGRNADVNVIFVGDDTMRRLNNEYLRHDYSTDVLSFPLGDAGDALEGEVYVCLDQAERQAPEYGAMPEEEVARLVVHGVLHLLGYEDDTKEERDAMRGREDALLGQLKRI